MSAAPEHLRYTKEHEWVEFLDGEKVRFGITDYAQTALGDIVFIQMPVVGDQISSGKVCGEVESTKSVSEIFAPVDGLVADINEALVSKPELINQEPYLGGWIAVVKSSASSSDSELLTAEEYLNLINS
jgi:glycine cleavage system H protein